MIVVIHSDSANLISSILPHLTPFRRIVPPTNRYRDRDIQPHAPPKPGADLKLLYAVASTSRHFFAQTPPVPEFDYSRLPPRKPKTRTPGRGTRRCPERFEDEFSANNVARLAGEESKRACGSAYVPSTSSTSVRSLEMYRVHTPTESVHRCPFNPSGGGGGCRGRRPMDSGRLTAVGGVLCRITDGGAHRPGGGAGLFV